MCKLYRDRSNGELKPYDSKMAFPSKKSSERDDHLLRDNTFHKKTEKQRRSISMFDNDFGAKSPTDSMRNSLEIVNQKHKTPNLDLVSTPVNQASLTLTPLN